MVGVFREKGQKLRKRDPYLDFSFDFIPDGFLSAVITQTQLFSLLSFINDSI